MGMEVTEVGEHPGGQGIIISLSGRRHGNVVVRLGFVRVVQIEGHTSRHASKLRRNSAESTPLGDWLWLAEP
jgi:hypothetical protein